jgi:tetratricopeptide (TPR) repeat protein
MTPELWERLKPLFNAAVEKPPAQRGEFLAQLCGDDAELRTQLSNLLKAHEEETIDIDPPPAGPQTAFVRDAPALQPNELLLNRFRIVRRIGGGGMGEVYEAVDIELNQTIGLKTIRGEFARHPGAFSLFKNEVQLARRVSGPNVCRIHEFFVVAPHDGFAAFAFFTMEILNGVTLAARLRRQDPPSLVEMKQIALDLCAGLTAIHQAGITHRDLKPQNIMLVPRSDRDYAVLMDFGVANESKLTASVHQEEMAGTPDYMAPEQFEGKATSPATDVYALGVVLYELFAGTHPFAAPTPIAAAARRASRPHPPSSARHNIPRHWDRIIARCLEYDPQRRFQSASEVSRALLTSPLDLANIRHDHPRLFLTACCVPLAALVWGGFHLWQVRHYYRPSPDALHWYQSGVAALQEGTYVRASRSLQEALDRDPAFPMAHARMAEAMADLDFQSDAQRELLISLPQQSHLPPLDRDYLNAIRATISLNYTDAIPRYAYILRRLPANQRSAGNVDLGMAYERSGDINRALNLYAAAAALDKSSPAPWMHIAVLQSRLLNPREANQAFDTARKLFTAELNQEGLAELDYEQGYALNVFGRAAEAKPYLTRALEEGINFDSAQLQVRALTQLSSADYFISSTDLSSEYQQANEEAERAEQIARDHRLDSWLADGLVRRANVQLLKHQPNQAEATIREAILLANQTGQLRVQAMANLTLASVMDQEGRPDQLIVPAEAARTYYQKHGYLLLAELSSVLITRAQRDQGKYQDALQSGDATLQMANQSGIHRLIMQSEDAVARIYGKLERYPEALPHYQRSASFADKDDDKGKELLRYADALWQIGRYRESDAVLDLLPATPAVQSYVAVERFASLVSRRKFDQAHTVVAHALHEYPDMDSDSRQEFAWDELLAQAYLHRGPAATRALQTLESKLATEDPPSAPARNLAIAEAALAAGQSKEAQQLAITAADRFAPATQPESAFRSALLAAAASKDSQDQAAGQTYRNKAVDILGLLKQTWGPDPLQSYLTRPDIAALAAHAGLPLPLPGRQR